MSSIRLFVFSFVFFTLGAMADENRYTLGECNFSNEQLAAAIKEKISPYFIGIQAPLALDSIVVNDSEMSSDRVYKIQFSISKSIQFRIENGPDLSIENLSSAGTLRPDLTTGSLVIERGILETFTNLGVPNGRFCVWSLPDSGIGAVIKNLSSQKTLIEVTDKLLGGLTARFTQPLVLLKQPL